MIQPIWDANGEPANTPRRRVELGLTRACNSARDELGYDSREFKRARRWLRWFNRWWPE